MNESVDQLSTKSSILPPRLKQNSDKDRQYRTALPGSFYSKLELEAVERGTTPYKLTGLIVMAYLKGELAESPQG
jgi:hypothetical protein